MAAISSVREMYISRTVVVVGIARVIGVDGLHSDYRMPWLPVAVLGKWQYFRCAKQLFYALCEENRYRK